MISKSRSDTITTLALVAVAVAAPFLFPSKYFVGQATLLFIWMLVVIQWNLVFGVAGIFSLAQLALFAIGGYCAAILGAAGVPLWFGVFLGAGLSGIFGLAIGLACFRLKGPYVALLTLAIAQAILVLIITDTSCVVQQGANCFPLTGGARGISQFGDFGFREILPYRYYPLGDYFVSLAALILGVVFSFLLMASPIGLTFRAIRDNPTYAVGRGVSRVRYQLIVFFGSAIFTGLAGGIYAAHVRVMGPNVLGLPLILTCLAMMVVGGLGHRWGPLIGALLITAANEMFKEVPEWQATGLGILLVGSVIFMPRGVMGLFSPTLFERVASKFARETTTRRKAEIEGLRRRRA
jgi:branched-chain amino acid transport system permease protein